jgi:hypothetical protein
MLNSMQAAKHLVMLPAHMHAAGLVSISAISAVRLLMYQRKCKVTNSEYNNAP